MKLLTDDQVLRVYRYVFPYSTIRQNDLAETIYDVRRVLEAPNVTAAECYVETWNWETKAQRRRSVKAMRALPRLLESVRAVVNDHENGYDDYNGELHEAMAKALADIDDVETAQQEAKCTF